MKALEWEERKEDIIFSYLVFIRIIRGRVLGVHLIWLFKIL